MEPRFVTKAACKVAGYELQTSCLDGRNNREIPAFWQSIMPEKLAILHQTLPAVNHNELGLCYPPDSTTGNFTYVIALEVTDFENVPTNLFRDELPETTYAIFAVPPTEDNGLAFTEAIQGTWRYIFETWFPTSGYEFAEGKVDYEYYYEGPKAEIFIPVVKKG